MNEVLILGRQNGAGLDRDAVLLERALTACRPGWEIQRPRVRGLHPLFLPKNSVDAAFHLERIAPLWTRSVKVNFLIPNQERYPERQIGRLRRVDHVLCKTRHAAEIFSRHHPSVHWIGFTSEDRRMEEIEPDYGRFFHLAGRSTVKNTGLLIDLWKKHPEWPVLTLVQHPDNAPARVPANVELIDRYLADEELRMLQNRCGIHLCPSLSEGWGHYLAEAMSCRAVTLTTDGPPMNELVDAGRGVLVPWIRKAPWRLGWNFHVDSGKLEKAVERLIAMPQAEKAEIGCEARRWFTANDRQFQERLASFLQKLADSGF